MDIINSGLETEQPIRVHFYDLTWWTWCLAQRHRCSFQIPEAVIEIRYGDFFGYLETAFYSGGLILVNIVCTMSMEFQSPRQDSKKVKGLLRDYDKMEFGIITLI